METQKFKCLYLPKKVEFWHSKSADTPALIFKNNPWTPYCLKLPDPTFASVGGAKQQFICHEWGSWSQSNKITWQKCESALKVKGFTTKEKGNESNLKGRILV